MNRPVIGITSCFNYEKNFYSLASYYINSVVGAGGIPFILPTVAELSIDDLLKRVDGVILSGGGDLHPFLLSQEPHPSLGEVDLERDKYELSLARKVLVADLPMLGICRGMQVLVVAAGGEIYQDLSQRKNVLQHMQNAPGWQPSHRVTVKENTLLYQIVGSKTIETNSFHHQSVRLLPSGFTVNALTQDGVIEGVERRDNPFILGVQWHPERQSSFSQQGKNIFAALIDASR